jgi:hypothetical protein
VTPAAIAGVQRERIVALHEVVIREVQADRSASKFSRFLLNASVKRVSLRMCSRVSSVQALHVAGRDQRKVWISDNALSSLPIRSLERL